MIEHFRIAKVLVFFVILAISPSMIYATNLASTNVGKATLLAPNQAISTNLPTYSWNAVPDSTWYLLWVRDTDASPKIRQWFTSAQAGCDQGQGTCSVSPAAVLAVGNCMWWIQAWNETGYGPWSDGMEFSVLPNLKATLLSPSGIIATATPTYLWKPAVGATFYQLFVGDSNSSPRIEAWYTAAQAGCAIGLGPCYVTPTVSLSEGSFLWWVQTWNSSGEGPWSDGMSFTIAGAIPPGKATLVSPAAMITTTTPTYTWNAVTGSKWYLLVVNISAGSGKINKLYSAEQAGCNAGTGTCSVKPDIVLDNRSYQWWIRTGNDSGAGPWSDGMTFTIGGGTTGPYNIEFVTVPAGEFQMGSNSNSGELPLHPVIISKSFQLGKYEITQGQWRTVMGSNPSLFKGDSLPVEQVSWNDVQTFIAKLNALNDGYCYRLPTEAEWEYACRAGTTGDYGGTGNLDEMGWYYDNSGWTTHQVGSKLANAWGLYDMHGNVLEWVQDWYGLYSSGTITDPSGPSSGSGRVARGGAWNYYGSSCRSAVRGDYGPDNKSYALGFRLLRTAQ